LLFLDSVGGPHSFLLVSFFSFPKSSWFKFLLLAGGLIEISAPGGIGIFDCLDWSPVISFFFFFCL